MNLSPLVRTLLNGGGLEEILRISQFSPERFFRGVGPIDLDAVVDALIARSMWISAREFLTSLIKYGPVRPDHYYNLGLVLFRLGDLDGEINTYKTAIGRFGPNFEICLNLSVAYLNSNDSLRSRHWAKKTLAMPQSGLGTYEVLGSTALNRGYRAIACTELKKYARSLPNFSLDQRATNLILELATVIDPMAHSRDQVLDERNRFKTTLDRLEDEVRSIRCGPSAAWALTKFSRTYIPYQQLPGDKELYQSLCRITQQVFSSAGTHANQTDTNHNPNGRKLGVVTTARFHQKLFCDEQILTFLDDFDVTYIVLNNPLYASPHGTIKRLDLALDYKSVGDVVAKIRNIGCDYVFFPEIGMSIECQILSAFKLGEFTFTSWLHPVTSGSCSVDAFLYPQKMHPVCHSLLESEEFSEEIISTPGIGLDLSSLAVRGADRNSTAGPIRTSLQLGIIQNPIKLTALDDEFHLKLLSENPDVTIHFVHGPIPLHTKKHRSRLNQKAKKLRGNALERMVWHPRMSANNLYQFLTRMNACLEPISWSGLNTAIDCMASGCPVITTTGRTLRSNHTAALYAEIDHTQGSNFFNMFSRRSQSDFGFLDTLRSVDARFDLIDSFARAKNMVGSMNLPAIKKPPKLGGFPTAD